MPRKYFRKYLPSHETVIQYRFLRLFGPLLTHPNLWHLNRRSVAGGVAIGAFTGLIPGPVQMIAAALLAIALRVNLPVAMATTLYTNPFTIVPLYVAAYHLGSWITGESNRLPSTDLETRSLADWIPALVDWLASLGRPFAVGLPLLGLLLALLGYLAVRGLWRLHVVHEWSKRRHCRRRAKKGPP